MINTLLNQIKETVEVSAIISKNKYLFTISFFKKLYGPFLRVMFNCVKSVKLLREHGLLLTTLPLKKRS